MQLTTTPILAFPDFNQEFVLDVDASGEGLGAILSQSIDGCECICKQNPLESGETILCHSSRIACLGMGYPTFPSIPLQATLHGAH